MNSPSLLPVAGWWVAWVYALSLSLPMLLVPIDSGWDPGWGDWAREVKFTAPGLKVSSDDPDGLAVLKAVATKPAPIAGTIKVMCEEETAKLGVDFVVSPRGAEIYFKKGAIEGELRRLSNGEADIRIKNDKQWREPRSFKLRLQSGPDAVAADDSATCLVTIVDGDKPPRPMDQNSVGFARAEVPVPLKELVTTPLEVEADAPVDKPAELTFKLYHGLDGDRRLLKEFTRTLPTGERRVKFDLDDVLSRPELEKFGLTDTGAAGRDETYEIDLMADRPLYPDNPRTCRIVAKNSNQAPKTTLVYFDKYRNKTPYLDPEGFVSVEYDQPIRNPSIHEISIDDVRLPGEVVVDANARRGNLVPLSDFDWKGRLGRICRLESVCTDGGCDGQDGGSDKRLCGEPIPGDYMLIVVNNERLHEAGDEIIAEVRRALAHDAAKPYGNGAIILNPADEDTLTPTSGGPKRDKMFQPYSQDGHDVAGQLKRIEEVVARKREAAANQDLRAVVVWPERALHGGEGVRQVAGEGLHPLSFLLPDAAASYARRVEEGLVPREASGRAVTVRAPKERELQAHLVNVIAEGRLAEGDSAE